MTNQRFSRASVRVIAICGLVALGLSGCDAFNPAFVNLIAPNVSATYATVPNPPGYVVVGMQNNVLIDGALIDYLADDLSLSPAEASALRARIRMRLRITFTDGTFQTVEFISGSGEFVDPAFDSTATPDLTRNTLTNVAVRCDVASVQLEPGTNVEVFIPVPLEIWELVEVTVGDVTNLVPQQRGTIPPQFQALQVDAVDADGNVILQRNIDVRDVLSPVTNIVCGSIVPVIVNGTLTVPFFAQANTGNPSFDQDDINTVAGIGGRYQFRVSAQ